MDISKLLKKWLNVKAAEKALSSGPKGGFHPELLSKEAKAAKEASDSILPSLSSKTDDATAIIPQESIPEDLVKSRLQNLENEIPAHERLLRDNPEIKQFQKGLDEDEMLRMAKEEAIKKLLNTKAAGLAGVGVLGGAALSSDEAEAGPKAPSSLGKALTGLIKKEAPLEMTEAARMARAKEIGFDTNKTWYRGTNNPNDFNTKRRDYKAFYTEDPNFASQYSGDMGADIGARVIPAYIKTNDIFDPSNPKHLSEIRDHLALELQAQPFNDMTELAHYSNTGLPSSPSILEKMSSHERADQYLKSLTHDPYNRRGSSWMMIETSPFRKALESAGFSGAHIREAGRNNIAIIKPSSVRSKFAKFDPSKADSSDITAGLAGAGVLGGAALGSNEASASVPKEEPTDWINESKKYMEEHTPLEAGLTGLNYVGNKYNQYITNPIKGAIRAAQKTESPVSGFLKSLGPEGEKVSTEDIVKGTNIPDEYKVSKFLLGHAIDMADPLQLAPTARFGKLGGLINASGFLPAFATEDEDKNKK